jgi:hypothetical protein
MTDTPHTVDDLLDLWDDHTAPTEPMLALELHHPSAMELRVIRVVGSPWQAIEHTGGTWSFTCHGETIWGPMTSTVDDAFRLLMQVHRDPSPRAESQGLRPGPTPRFWRGVAWALPASLALWAVIIWAAGRLAGKW